MQSLKGLPEMNKKSKITPDIGEKILKIFAKDRDGESFSGDIEEFYLMHLENKGKLYAIVWYWFQIFRSIWTNISVSIKWSITMFNNYLKIAFRNIMRYKGYSIINIAGLAAGITCSIYIILYIQLHLSYDNYHKDIDRLYIVGFESKSENGNQVYYANFTPTGKIIRENYPDAECVARRTGWSRQVPVKYGEKLFYEKWVNYAESEMFDIFDIPFVKGDPSTALDRRNTAVITEEIAGKYFGDEDPIGKTLLIETTEYEITGVIEDQPRNTHLNYRIYMSWTNLADMEWSRGWQGIVTIVYVRLVLGADPVEFESKIRNIAHEYNGEEFKQRGVENSNFIFKVKDRHLFPGKAESISNNLLYLYIYIIVGVFILLIACMNFMNLSTARSINRSGEVGMRKVAGAHRSQLITQFISESIVTTLIAFVLAVILAVLFMQLYNDLAGTRFLFSDMLKTEIILGITGLLLFISFAAGSYPAFFLSSFDPAGVIKGSRKAGIRGAFMRKYLVIGQFAISIILITGTLIVYNQLNFMRNKHLGFEKEQKLVVTLQGWRLITDNYEFVKSEFARHSSVLDVSAASGVPGKGINNYYTFPKGEEVENQHAPMALRCDNDFIPAYKINLLEGRQFNPEINADVTSKTFIINISLVKAFGWNSPEEAIGKELGNDSGTVIGVVEDFHWYGLQSEIEPLIMRFVPALFKYITLTINTENLPETLSSVEDTYRKLFPGQIFEYFFVDENFDLQYRNEERLGRIFSVFSLLGIFIACLGLFGLASFMAEQRTKEIGIRKVLGSSISSIILLFSKEFVKWIAVSLVIAWPLGYYIMNIWLQNFAYSVNLGIWPFMLAGVAAVIITAITISYQIIRAATANPVESLRYE